MLEINETLSIKIHVFRPRTTLEMIVGQEDPNKCFENAQGNNFLFYGYELLLLYACSKLSCTNFDSLII